MNRQSFVLTMVLVTIALLFVTATPMSELQNETMTSSFVLSDGEAWLTGWTYRQSHTINKVSDVGVNYQILIHVEYGSGTSTGNIIYCDSKSTTDFGDIRFTDNDGDTELDYWIEEKTNSDDATFWVEVADSLDDSGGAGTVVIYVYYGNDGEPTSSDGDATFLLFDDFNDASINGAKWDTDGATESGGIISIAAGSKYIASDNTFGPDIAVEARMEMAGNQKKNYGFGTAVPFTASMWICHDYDGGTYTYEGNSDAGSLTLTSGVYEIQSLMWKENYGSYDVDRGSVQTRSDGDIYHAAMKVGAQTWGSATDALAIDWIFVRNWASTEPSHSTWGSEEEFNNAPINDQTPVCTNLDDTDFLYAQYTLYEFDVSVTDLQGFADIDYVQLISYDFGETTSRWGVEFDQDTSTFSEVSGAGNIELVVGSSSYNEDGINLDITFALYIEWIHPDASDDDLKQIVYDDSTEHDDDLYDSNYNYETRLDFFVGPTIYDGVGTADRGDINDDLIMASVNIRYFGTVYHYPDDSEVDVWASCADVSSGGNPSAWSDTVSPDSTYYLGMASDDVVGEDTYTFITVAEGTGSGGTDLNHATHTDTYIADRVQVQSYSVSDERQSINANVNIDVTLDYDYLNQDVTDGTVTINGYSASHQGSGVWRITQQTNVPSLITYNTVVVTGNVHGITQEDQNGQSQGVIWDRVNLTLSSNYGWSVVGYNTTFSATGVFEYDLEAWSGVVTWNDQFPVESTPNTYDYGASRITSITDPTYGVVAFQVGEQASVIFDDAEVSSVAYYWVQYSVNSVWLIYQTGTWTWVVNGTTLDTGTDTVCIIQSEMNNTNDDWAIMDDTGDIGDLIIGEFDTTWYFVKIDLMCETTIGGRSFDWEVRSNTLDVDIMHSIHITDSGMNIQDEWITFYFHTNWNNATFYIWNNDSLVGSTVEGWYQIDKPSAVGLHNFTILVNGTQSTVTDAEQTKDFSVSDSWEWLNFKFTVNPVTFSITDIYVMQNNASIIVGGIFHTSDLSIDYTIYEDGVGIASGTVNIPASGDYYVIRWDKSSETSVANWTLVMASGTNITVYGYNMQMDTAAYTYNSSGQWIEENYIVGESVEVAVARATESMWDTFGLILILLIIPFVVGIAVKIDRKKSRSGKRDKANDKFRSN